MGRDHDDGIARLDRIFTTRGDDLSAAVDAGNQKVIFKGQLFQRNADERCVFFHTELQRLGFVILLLTLSELS